MEKLAKNCRKTVDLAPKMPYTNSFVHFLFTLTMWDANFQRKCSPNCGVPWNPEAHRCISAYVYTSLHTCTCWCTRGCTRMQSLSLISILLAIISTQKVALSVDALSECNARAYLPVLYVPECPHVHVHIHKEQWTTKLDNYPSDLLS